MKLIPKNWEKFQQYKDRKPSWIKLHRDLLNDFSYSSVRIGTKATLPLLWLLACEYEYGEIEASVEEISFRIHIDKETVKVAIKELVEHGFFTCVQDDTEAYRMVPREEKRRDREREETERESVHIPDNEELNKLFSEYLKLRKKKNYSLSDTVITRLLNKLQKYAIAGHDPAEVIGNAINGSWKDFFEPKSDIQNKSFKQQDAQKTEDALDVFMDARENGFDLRNTNEYEVEVIDYEA